MTEFEDVNVGDKVRLTGKHFDTTIEGVVEWIQAEPAWLAITGAGTYSAENWSVEVLESAPKPLPTEPGLYRGPRSTALFLLDEKGQWWTDASGRWSVILPEMHKYIPHDIARLVPETETVKEIARWLRSVGSTYWADRVKSKFGGKA